MQYGSRCGGEDAGGRAALRIMRQRIAVSSQECRYYNKGDWEVSMKRGLWLLALVAAAALGGSAWGDDRVLVIPFNVLNVPASQQWIGKGVEESLVAQLGRSGGMTPVAFTGPVIVEDNATAARLARSANAPLALRGTAQVVGESVRLTAQLIDSKSGETVRTALVTGGTADLLQLEDDLAGQLRGTPATVATQPPAAPPVAPVVVPAAPPQVIIISQPQPVYYPIYPYAYSYPYNYSYPLGYYPVVLYQVTPGNRGHGRDRDGNDGRARGGNGGPHIVQTGGGGFNPNGLPIPNNNVLPIPTNNVLPVPTTNILPIPTNNVLPLPRNNTLPLAHNTAAPLPTNRVAPIPAISVPTPRTNAGQNRNPRLVN
jgi:TolB-like protein